AAKIKDAGLSAFAGITVHCGCSSRWNACRGCGRRREVLATCNFTSGREKLRPAFHRRVGNALGHPDEGCAIFFLHKRHALQN
ncbi:hypothetical protein, partial [Pseudomonas aeruginosa]|uniref:hypothetical protein n=1 Tax=Pseudomonas aeruginosa TaxID=287 RepID=UPI001C49D4EE